MLALMMTMYLTQLKVAYLTFDDGPSSNTLAIAQTLEEHDVSGLFFVIGNYIDEHPKGVEIIQTLIDKNHQIGLHSMSHNRNLLYERTSSGEIFAKEMKQLQEKVYNLTDVWSEVCRAPYSRKLYFSKQHYDALNREGIAYLDWNVDSKDWQNISSDQIVENVKANIASLKNDSVVVLLFHETKQTIDALPEVIQYLKDEQYEFAIYDENTNLQSLIKYD